MANIEVITQINDLLDADTTTIAKTALGVLGAATKGDASIVAADLATSAVTETKIADGAVTAGKIGALAVTDAKLAANAVTTAKILDANVTAAKLATGAAEANITLLPLAKGGTNAITASAARTNILPAYANNAGKVLAVNAAATDVEYIAAAAGGTPADGSITTDKLAANAVTFDKLGIDYYDDFSRRTAGELLTGNVTTPIYGGFYKQNTSSGTRPSFTSSTALPGSPSCVALQGNGLFYFGNVLAREFQSGTFVFEYNPVTTGAGGGLLPNDITFAIAYTELLPGDNLGINLPGWDGASAKGGMLHIRVNRTGVQAVDRTGAAGGVGSFVTLTPIAGTVGAGPYPWRQELSTDPGPPFGQRFSINISIVGDELRLSAIPGCVITYKDAAVAAAKGRYWWCEYDANNSANATQYPRLHKAYINSPIIQLDPCINNVSTALANLSTGASPLLKATVSGGSQTNSKLSLIPTIATSVGGTAISMAVGNNGSIEAFRVGGLYGKVKIGSDNTAPDETSNNRCGLQVVDSSALGQLMLSDNVGADTTKTFQLTGGHYDNGWRTWRAICGSSSSSANTLEIGGNAINQPSATAIDFYTSASQTAAPSKRLSISTNGTIATETVGRTIGVKSGANALSGTFIANGATPVAVATTAWDANCVAIITLKTIGGTVTTQPFVSSVTAGTGFSVTSAAGDTSVYNWVALKVN